jgi:hypothetical protein
VVGSEFTVKEEKAMRNARWPKWLALTTVLLISIAAFVLLGILLGPRPADARPPAASVAPARAAGDYVILAWNNLGMHCYDSDFQDIAILPPYNTLWAQVVRVGDPPQIITAGITLTYAFTDNTYSVGKTNFWDYAQPLFGITLAPNVGLTGKGLADRMDPVGDHFEAEGIPLTEFRDSDLVNRYPYQLATVVAYDRNKAELAHTIAVAPVSTEMYCVNCHCDDCDATTTYPITPTGKVETNILALHDYLSMGQYPPGHSGPLMDRRPILCAECHASAALGAPGVAGVKSLSNAMHYHHRNLPDITPDTDGCYNCHPGPETRCLRDVMSQQAGMTCINCHGTMSQVSQNPDPWLHEPQCSVCHGPAYTQDQALYRFSQEHGGIRCEACHDSTHAIAPSREPNDAIKFIAWQGHPGTLLDCTVCHLTMPAGPGPHGLTAPIGPRFIFAPDHASALDPGAQGLYIHGLQNTGNVSDTYTLSWSSSQGWVTVTGRLEGLTFTVPGVAVLQPGQSAFLFVTVTVPSPVPVLGEVDRTIITATSALSPTQVARVTDITLVPVTRLGLTWISVRDGARKR